VNHNEISRLESFWSQVPCLMAALTSMTPDTTAQPVRSRSGLFEIDVRTGFERAVRDATENALTCYREAAKARAAGDELEARACASSPSSRWTWRAMCCAGSNRWTRPSDRRRRTPTRLRTNVLRFGSRATTGIVGRAL
jgi:hypothetical protein